MILQARADSVRLEADEAGWQLVVDTDEGDSLIVNIHGAAYEFGTSEGIKELILWTYEATKGEGGETLWGPERP